MIDILAEEVSSSLKRSAEKMRVFEADNQF